MQSKQIVCPKCKTTLVVNNPKNQLVKVVKCPKCGVGLAVRFPADQQQAPIAPAGNEKTQIADQSTVLQQHVNPARAPRLLLGNQPYALNNGRNIVGRKADSSQANVQINTTDLCMSRHHIAIDINATNSGTSATLSPLPSKNGTVINNIRLQPNAVIRLNDGDRITMGYTTVIYKEN